MEYLHVFSKSPAGNEHLGYIYISEQLLELLGASDVSLLHNKILTIHEPAHLSADDQVSLDMLRAYVAHNMEGIIHYTVGNLIM